MASIEAQSRSQAVASAAVQHCKAAVRWRTNTSAYGYDGSRMGAWGHWGGGSRRR